MLSCGILSASDAEAAYKKMRDEGSRLPWEKAEKQLKKYR